jgi:beta-phosphoglucomutase-like phosphatase (HAD superfamily)
MKPTAVIFDMDGTLADVSSIRHHLTAFDESKRRVVKHFDKFHSESVNVPPHTHVVNAAQVAHMLGHKILIVTARKHMWRHQTAWWLAMHGVPSDMLIMRGDMDQRKDYLVKKDMLATIKQAYNVIHAWDDNPSIIKLWTEEGIPCTIVDGWDHG